MSTPTDPTARPAIWAEAGTKVEPDTGSQQTGWVAGKPGRGKFNWLLNWLDNAIQWLLVNVILGLTNYVNTKDYAVGARVQDVTTHESYRCIQANGPSTTVKALDQTGYWVRWGHTDDQVNGQVDTKLGTLSGETATGVTLNNSATYSDAHHLNLPNTTHKILFLKVRVPQAAGTGGCTVTLSGATAFNTGAKHVMASVADTQFLGSSTGVTAWLTSGTVANVLVAGTGAATYADVDLMISGW